MPRPRRKTELFGFMATVEESLILRAYLKTRQLTATQYLRQCALQPVLDQAADRQGDGGGEEG
jgi:hypothetical protein